MTKQLKTGTRLKQLNFKKLQKSSEMSGFEVFVVGFLFFLGGVWIAYKLWERDRIRRKRSLQELQKMDWRGFEFRVAGRLKLKGRTNVSVGKGRGDGGVDVQGWKDGQKRVIQCKRFGPKTNVPVEVVRDLLGTMVSEKASRCMIVTTGKLTVPARGFCKKNNMVIVEGYDVLDL